MEKWADYLISEVSYDLNHLISVAIRHKDTASGITKGESVDRLTIASDIKNGLIYITIYSGNNSWKKGHQIQTFSIDGTPYLRIDRNKVKLDYLGDLPEAPFVKSDILDEPISESEDDEATQEQLDRLEQLEKQLQALESKSTIQEPPSSPRGSLPKTTAEELPQELELVPEPISESEDDEATQEQITQLNDLQNQIDELERILSSQIIIESKLEKDDEATQEQITQLNDLQNQIDELENLLSTNSNLTKSTSPDESSIDELETSALENEITKTLQKQNKKLDSIEKKIQNPSSIKNDTKSSLEAYCVKCKSKRMIREPQETTMKNGRPAVKGFCFVCNCKVFRIGKMKK